MIAITIEQRIENSKAIRANKALQEEEKNVDDYFKDMVPQIRKPKKVSCLNALCCIKSLLLTLGFTNLIHSTTYTRNIVPFILCQNNHLLFFTS